MANEELFHGRVGGGNQWMYLKRNADQENKIINENTKVYVDAVKKKKEAEEALQKKIKDLKNKTDAVSKAELAKERSNLSKVRAERIKAEKTLVEEKEKIRKKAARAAEIFEQNRYKNMSQRERMQYQKDVSEKLKLDLKALKDKYAAYEAEQQRLNNILRSKTATAEEKKQAKSDLASVEKKKSDVSEEIGDKETAVKEVSELAENLFNTFATKSEKAKKAAEEYTKAEQKKFEAMAEARGALEKYKEALKNNADPEIIKALEEEYNAKQKLADQAKDNAKEALKEKNKTESQAKSEKTEEEKSKERAAQFAAVAGQAVDGVANALNSLYGQQGRMIARLQGSDIDWKKAVLNVTTTVGVSGFVSQRNLVAKMVELVDSGVAYNLEMRAFLAETSANIASTFDAANGTLLRLIRLQQADTTAARLGMEAALTKLFNERFQDSSYLTSDTNQTVQGSILDVIATLDKNAAVELEYNVQKWLGALYSLGLSDQAVSTIAQGINYLGTGNVTGLSGNTALQTLFAMSAARSGGKSYAELLTGGLNAEETNKLLKAMVKYLAEIATSQTNYVTKSAYAELFGMSITDLSTFSSLKTEELEALYNNTQTYDKLYDETKSQLNEVKSRLNIAQVVDTMFENAETGAASLIGSNAVTYTMWKTLALLKQYVGKIEIPGITGFGTGLASGLDLLNLSQTVMAGLGMIGTFMGGLGSMFSGGPMNLSNWDFKEYTNRGSGLAILDTGSLSTSSYSESIGAGSGSGSDVSEVSMESGKEAGMEAAGTTSAEMDEQKEIPQKILDALAGETTPTVISLLQDIDNKLHPNRVFYTSIAGALNASSAAQITALSSMITTNTTTGGSSETPSSVSSSAESKQSASESGNSTSPTSVESVDMATLIQDAVRDAIAFALSSYTTTGFPVRVTNGG